MDYLGNLAKFPYEIRVMIWEELRPQGHDTVTSSSRVKKVRKSGLAILRANRDIYYEISRPLYKKTTMAMTFEISPIYEKDVWIVARCNQGRAVWRLKDEVDAVNRHLLTGFPYDKFDINVDILAPERGDEGQLICLWQKVNRFVDFIGRITTTTTTTTSSSTVPGKYIKNMTLRFQKNTATGADWYDYNKKDMMKPALCIVRCEYLPIKKSIEATTDDIRPHSTGDIAFAPFMRLRNVQTFHVTAHSSELQQALNQELIIDNGKRLIEERLGHTFLFPKSTTNREFNRDAIQVDRGIHSIYLHINYILDLALDVIEGHQANMLRLDRYANWFAKGHQGTSKYETDFLAALEKCGHLVQIYDEHHFFALLRIKILLAVNPERRKWNTHRRYRHKEGWNPQSWLKDYPTGIPAAATPDFIKMFGNLVDVNADNKKENRIWQDYTDKDPFYLRLRKIVENEVMGAGAEERN